MRQLIQRILGWAPSDSIIPPMQNGPSLHFYPEPLPDFRFGVASLVGSKSDRKVKVEFSFPQADMASCSDRKMISDSYIVQVPEFSGDRVVDVTLEERFRNREIAVCDSGLIDNDQERLQHYTIGVPYTCCDDDGIARNCSRIEIRKRKALPNEIAVSFVPRIVKATYELGQVECYSRKKKRLNPKQILKMLKNESPALLVNDLRFVTTYFERLLASSVIVIIDDGQGVAVD